MNIHWILALLLLLCQSAWAGSKIDHIDSLSQNLFKDLTSNLGAAIGYKALTAGDPLETLGFEASSTYSNTDIETDAPVSFSLPRVSLQNRGLPSGIDIGGFYSSTPAGNISLIGGEVSYALLQATPSNPAVSIRGNFTRLSGVEDFDLMTRGLELSISKGFDTFTPYAGLGTVWINGETSVDGLNSENLTKNKYFLGFNVNLGLMTFSAETEQTGDSATASAKFGLRF